MKTLLTDLWAYVIWADRLVLEAARAVDDAGYRRERDISHGSIHKLLVHAYSAQRIWLRRCQGDTSEAWATADDLPTLASLRAVWSTLHAEETAYLDSQTDQTLAQAVEYTRRKQKQTGLRWQMLLHAADHATYHRGQLNTMIKLAGATPVAAGDYVTFCRQREGRDAG